MVAHVFKSSSCGADAGKSLLVQSQLEQQRDLKKKVLKMVLLLFYFVF